MIRKLALAALLLLLLPIAAAAQTPVPSPTPAATKLAWDHNNVNTDGFTLQVGTATPTNVVTTAISGGFTTPFPALTPGVHNLSVRAYNVAGVTPTPATLSVRLVVLADSPTNLRIIPGDVFALLMGQLMTTVAH